MKARKISQDEAVLIRQLRKEGMTPVELVTRFNVSRATISNILTGRTHTSYLATRGGERAFNPFNRNLKRGTA